MSTPTRSLTLLLPDLLWPGPDNAMPHPATDLSVPSLERLLSRAKTGPGSPADSDRALFDLFQVEYQSQIPAAPVTLTADRGEPIEGYWLRADPVHLRPDRDRLVLFDQRVLNITQHEAEQLAQALTEHFAADGWDLLAATAERWYLRLPEAPRINTDPLAAVVGRDVLPHLPRGEHGKIWHGWLNEVQMVLHLSPVNAAREAKGMLPVNSLWFWGGGESPFVAKEIFAQVWSNNPIAVGLAKLGKTPHTGIPTNGSTWLEAAIIPGEHLLVLDHLPDLLAFGEVEAWCQAVADLEQNWFTPLLAALKSGALTHLTLHPGDGRCFTATRTRIRRWWQRTRPFHTLPERLLIGRD